MKKLYLNLEKIPARFLLLFFILACLLSLTFLHPRIRHIWNQNHREQLLHTFIENTIQQQALSLQEYLYLRDTISTDSLDYNPEILKPHSILKFQTIETPKSDLFSFTTKNIHTQESLVQNESVKTLFEQAVLESTYAVLVRNENLLVLKNDDSTQYVVVSSHTFSEFQNHQGLIDFEGVDAILDPDKWSWVIRTEVDFN